MTPLLFTRQNTPNSSLPTLTPSTPTCSSQWRPLTNKDSITVYRKPIHMDQYLLWTAITASPTNMVHSAYSHIGPRQFTQTNSYWDKNFNISGLPWASTVTPMGSFTDFKLSWTFNLVFSTTTTILILARDINKTKDIFMVVPYSKGHSKSLKNAHGKAGVQINFMGKNTIMLYNILVV